MLNHIGQLTNISGPVMGLQQLDGRRIKVAEQGIEIFVDIRSLPCQKVLRQLRNVFYTISQRRKLNFKCVDSIKQILSELAQMLSDSYSGCVALGQYFVEQVGEEGKYVELLGILGDNNTLNRSKGFHSVVDRFPKLKMVAQQSAEFDRAKGLEVMESLLQKNPDIKAVFCGNDSMAMGAYQALKAAGKDSQVKVFGFDGADDVVKLIAEKKIAATGMQFPKKMAQQSAEFADQYIKGKRDFAQKIPVKVDLVTQENVHKYGDYGKKQ